MAPKTGCSGMPGWFISILMVTVLKPCFHFEDARLLKKTQIAKLLHWALICRQNWAAHKGNFTFVKVDDK